MKLSPFRVSFDGPLDRRAQRRARVVTATFVLGAVILGSVAMQALLNASSGTIGAWTNAKLAEEQSTTGVASPVESAKPAALAPKPAASAPKPAALTSKPATLAPFVATREAVRVPDRSASAPPAREANPAPAREASPPVPETLKPMLETRKPQTRAQAKSTRRPPQRLRVEDARSREDADARTERLWRERAARVGRGPQDGFRPFQ